MSRTWSEPETPNSAVIEITDVVKAAGNKGRSSGFWLGLLLATCFWLPSALFLWAIEPLPVPSVRDMVTDLGDYGQFTVKPLQEGLYEVSVISRFDGHASSYWGESVEAAIANAAAGEGYRVRLKGLR